MIMNVRIGSLVVVAAVCAAFVLSAADAARAQGASDRTEAAEILKLSGVRGGLVVHLGCGGGKLTAALRAGAQYVVQGLDADAGDVKTARDHIRSLGLYGDVSVRRWDRTTMPYIDNLVNLVVCEDPGKVATEEIMRALVPNGVLCVRKNGKWATKAVKPRPADIDEWTHYMHDPSNNAVAHDTVIGPVR